MKNDRYFRNNEKTHKPRLQFNGRRKNSLSVLVAEDDSDAALLIQMALQAWQLPLEAEYVHDGDTAMRKIMKKQPDILILDLRLPLMDGFSIMRNCLQNRQHMAIIVVSGLRQEDINAIGQLPSNAHVMQKPMNLMHFRQLLEQLVTDAIQRGILQH